MARVINARSLNKNRQWNGFLDDLNTNDRQDKSRKFFSHSSSDTFPSLPCISWGTFCTVDLVTIRDDVGKSIVPIHRWRRYLFWSTRFLIFPTRKYVARVQRNTMQCNRKNAPTHSDRYIGVVYSHALHITALTEQRGIRILFYFSVTRYCERWRIRDEFFVNVRAFWEKTTIFLHIRRRVQTSFSSSASWIFRPSWQIFYVSRVFFSSRDIVWSTTFLSTVLTQLFSNAFRS